MSNILKMFDQVFKDFFLVAANKSFRTSRTFHEAVTAVMTHQRRSMNALPAERVGDTEEPVDRQSTPHVEVCLDVTDGC